VSERYHYSEAIELDATYSETYTSRGEALASFGKYDKAMADFDKALALNPGDIHAYAARALVISLSKSL
jgi:tetratricopeptide (TPR) repeat protein